MEPTILRGYPNLINDCVQVWIRGEWMPAKAILVDHLSVNITENGS